MDSFAKTYKTYCEAEYVKMLNIRDKYPTLTKHFAIQYSHLFRLELINKQMLNTMRINKIATTTAIFKVKQGNDDCVYAYLYSTGGDISHVACSSTFRSQDGEYRYRLNNWSHFVRLLEQYEQVYEIVEELVLAKMASGGLSLYVELCYPFVNKNSPKALEDRLINERVALRLFVIGWLCDYYLIHYQISQNHMHATYRAIIYKETDAPVFNKVIEMLGGVDKYDEMVNTFSQHQCRDAPKLPFQYPMYGQKVFPLTLKESLRREDIRYAVWREIYIAKICSDSVLNLITPSFPLTGNWFYIQNARSEIFDNKAMHEHFKNSEVSVKIAEELRRVDLQNYNDQDKNRGPINGKFIQTSEKINAAITFLDSYITTTNLSVGIVLEHLGRTIRDMPFLALNNKFETGKYIETFHTNPKSYIGNLFEYIYTLAIMNEKFRLIHGDLHANNATIFEYCTDARPKGMHKVYIKDGVMYKFEYGNFVSGIIDFSRGIVGNIESVVERFGEAFTSQLIEDQSVRLVKILVNYFPKFLTEYRLPIDKLIRNNFKLMFKIMTLIDTYSLFKALYMLFTTEKDFTEKIQVHQVIIQFAQKIYNYTENLFIDLMQKAINGTIDDHTKIEFPNITILRDNFTEYECADGEINFIVGDIFNGDNTIIHQFDDAKYPFSEEIEVEMMRAGVVSVGDDTAGTAPHVDKLERKIKAKYNDLQSETVEINNILVKYDSQEDYSFDKTWTYL